MWLFLANIRLFTFPQAIISPHARYAPNFYIRESTCQQHNQRGLLPRFLGGDKVTDSLEFNGRLTLLARVLTQRYFGKPEVLPVFEPLLSSASAGRIAPKLWQLLRFIHFANHKPVLGVRPFCD
jgi:hypothetical protein